jgi:hypothetical protein
MSKMAHHLNRSPNLACPFFMPVRKSEDGVWQHPSRLPLGGGWTGFCCAPGYEGVQPTDEELRSFCNLGYATNCPRLPKERPCDAVRFGIARDTGSQLFLLFVCEAGHLPTTHGTLQYDLSLGLWVLSHADPQIQKMAECYLESYLLRRIPSTQAISSAKETHDSSTYEAK